MRHPDGINAAKPAPSSWSAQSSRQRFPTQSSLLVLPILSFSSLSTGKLDSHSKEKSYTTEETYRSVHTLFTHIWEYSPPSLTILVKLPMLLFWAGLSCVLEFILFTYQRRRYSSCLSLKQSSGDPSHQYTAVPQCLQGIGSRTVPRSYQNPWALKPLI